MHRSSKKHAMKHVKKGSGNGVKWLVAAVVLVVLLAVLFVWLGSNRKPAEEPDDVSGSSAPETETNEPDSSETEVGEEAETDEEFETSEESDMYEESETSEEDEFSYVEEESDPETEYYPEEEFPEVSAPEAGSIDYETYLALTVEEQQAYYENFETPDDFFVWLEEAEAEYEANRENEPSENSGFFIEEGVEDWE